MKQLVIVFPDAVDTKTAVKIIKRMIKKHERDSVLSSAILLDTIAKATGVHAQTAIEK